MAIGEAIRNETAQALDGSIAVTRPDFATAGCWRSIRWWLTCATNRGAVMEGRVF